MVVLLLAAGGEVSWVSSVSSVDQLHEPVHHGAQQVACHDHNPGPDDKPIYVRVPPDQGRIGVL